MTCKIKALKYSNGSIIKRVQILEVFGWHQSRVDIGRVASVMDTTVVLPQNCPFFTRLPCSGGAVTQLATRQGPTYMNIRREVGRKVNHESLLQNDSRRLASTQSLAHKKSCAKLPKKKKVCRWNSSCLSMCLCFMQN